MDSDWAWIAVVFLAVLVGRFSSQESRLISACLVLAVAGVGPVGVILFIITWPLLGVVDTIKGVVNS